MSIWQLHKRTDYTEYIPCECASKNEHFTRDWKCAIQFAHDETINHFKSTWPINPIPELDSSHLNSFLVSCNRMVFTAGKKQKLLPCPSSGPVMF